MFTRKRHSGFTLVELMIALTIVSIASTAALTVYFSHSLSAQLSGQRRTASLAAQEKLEEIRIALVSGSTTDQVWADYGPLPTTSGGPKATFAVPGLMQDGTVVQGTVTIINDETPDESQFGYNYNGGVPTRFGVDLNGNRSYSDLIPAPFPLDLNSNGKLDDHNVTSGFVLLPVVVTIRWVGPYGSERLDMFAIIARDSQP